MRREDERQESTGRPLLSVIVPIYNVEKYLEQCLESLEAQTFKDMEIILVNDGSTDNSPIIAREHAARDGRFRLVEQPNKGFAGARNTGLEMAGGKYIGFVDSDDYIAVDMYEKLVQAAEQASADMAFCSFNQHFIKPVRCLPKDNSAQLALLARSGGHFRGAEELIFDDGTIWNRIYRRDMIEKHGIRFMSSMTFGEDVFFYWTALCFSQKIVAIPDCLYQYRRQRTGSQTTTTDRRIFAYLTTCREFHKFITQNGFQYLEPWVNHLFISYLSFGYERLDRKLQREYLHAVRLLFDEIGLTRSSPIAVMKSQGSIAHRLRYWLLKHLHPIALRAILSESSFRFNAVILFRKALIRLQVLLLIK